MDFMDKNKKEEEGFELPEVEGAKVVKVRIHISDEGCESCSA
jgi:hypothetical protein